VQFIPNILTISVESDKITLEWKQNNYKMLFLF